MSCLIILLATITEFGQETVYLDEKERSDENHTVVFSVRKTVADVNDTVVFSVRKTVAGESVCVNNPFVNRGVESKIMEVVNSREKVPRQNRKV